MKDFEVHPTGTAERISRLEQELNMYRSKVKGSDRKSQVEYDIGNNLMMNITGNNFDVGITSDW